MFPLHCNKCFLRHKLEPTFEFYVSRCGHILCKSCLQETCPVCSKPFNAVAVNNEMPPAMLEYFDDPLKLFRRFQKVTKFQYDQEKSLAEFLSISNERAEKHAKDAQRNYSKIQESFQCKIDKERERIRKYREYISYYERRLEQSRYMTPPITGQSRPRYPARKGSSDAAGAVDFMPQLTQTIKANYQAPRSPTLSTNDDSSIVTGDYDISEILEQRSKSRTPPPPMHPCVEQRKSKPIFSYTKYSK